MNTAAINIGMHVGCKKEVKEIRTDKQIRGSQLLLNPS
jgi:hypothetical protein